MYCHSRPFKTHSVFENFSKKFDGPVKKNSPKFSKQANLELRQSEKGQIHWRFCNLSRMSVWRKLDPNIPIIEVTSFDIFVLVWNYILGCKLHGHTSFVWIDMCQNRIEICGETTYWNTTRKWNSWKLPQRIWIIDEYYVWMFIENFEIQLWGWRREF